MNSKIVNFLLGMSAIWTVFIPSFGVAQSNDAEQCSLHLREIVQARDFNLSYYCSGVLLRQDPENPDLLLIRARAALEIGQPEEAYDLSAESRIHAATDHQKFVSYLISGIASSAQEKYISAKYYLRSSANYSQNDQDLAVVARAMASARANSPWSYRFSFSIDPSTNINGGSIHDYGVFTNITNPGGDPVNAELSDDAQAQAGIGYSLILGATHRTKLSDRARWENSVSASGSMFGGLGRNNYRLGVKSGIRFVTSDPTPARWFASVAYDQVYVAEELDGAGASEYYLYNDQISLNLEREWKTEAGNHWSAYASYILRNSGTDSDEDAQTIRAGAGYYYPLMDNVQLQVSGFFENTNSIDAGTARTAQNVAIGVSWDVQDAPLTISGSVSYTNIDYKRLDFLFPEVRNDDNVALRISVAPQKVQFFGFRPIFGGEATRNFSNLERYDTMEYSVFTKISSVF